MAILSHAVGAPNIGRGDAQDGFAMAQAGSSTTTAATSTASPAASHLGPCWLARVSRRAQPAAAEPTPHVTSPTQPSTQCRTTGPVSPEYKTFPSGRFQATPRTPSGKPTGGPIQNVVHGGPRLRLCSTRRTTAWTACGCAPKVAASSLSLTGPLPRRGSATTSARGGQVQAGGQEEAPYVGLRGASRGTLRTATRTKARPLPLQGPGAADLTACLVSCGRESQGQHRWQVRGTGPHCGS